MRTSIFMAGLIGLLLGGSANGQAPVQLQWNLNPGNNFSLEFEQQIEQTMVLQNMPVKQTQKHSYSFSYYPKGKKGLGWSVVQKIDRVKIEIDLGGNKITADSAAPAGDAATKFYAAMVGTELELVLDKEFRVTQVRGADRLEQKIASATPELAAQFKQLMNEQTLKQMGSFFQVVPAQPVKAGDRWGHDVIVDLGPLGTSKQLNHFQYLGAEGKLHSIKNEPTFTYGPPAANAAGLPFKIKNANLSTTFSAGKALFDNKNGLLQSSEVEMKMAGKLSIEVGGQVTDMELTQTQKTSIRLK